MVSDLFFVIYSESSANSTRGIVPRVATMTRDEIINLAWAKVDRRGESLGDYSLSEAASAAGYSDDKLLSLSVEELGDDGRLFLTFSESEVEDFIEDAARFGVLEEAREEAREVRTVLQITKAEWQKTHRDFKSVIDGQRYVLRMTKHGTALIPVELLKE